MRRLLGLVLLAALTTTGIVTALAQGTYPTRPVRLIIGFAAGTSSDIIARVYAQKLTEYFGQQFIVESRVGAAGNLAAEAVAKSPPDGHMLVLGGPTNASSVSLFKNLNYRLLEDLMPVAVLGSAPNIVVVNNDLGVNSIKDLIALAKSRSEPLLFGSAGVGTVPHLTGELFNLRAGVKLVHVPYRGNNLALVDLLGGRIALLFAPAPNVTSHISSGQVKALATTAATRTALAPHLPTLAEAGLPGVETSLWYGFWAAKGTPKPIITMLGDAFVKATNAPDVRESLAKNGIEPLPMGPAQFDTFIRAEVEKWRNVVEFAKIQVN